MSLATIKWEEKYETGISKIDLEHKIFLGLVNSFANALNENLDNDYIVKIVEEIGIYAKFHFFSEENIMRIINYPDLEEHKKEHLALLDAFNTESFEENLYTGFYDYLVDWFFNHTTTTDKEIRQYIDENKIDINSSNLKINF